MLKYFKKTFTDATDQELQLQQYMEESQTFHGRRATAAGIAYTNERQWKSNYILVNVIAEGYDIKRFLETLVREKGTVTRQRLPHIFRLHAQHRLFHARRAQDSDPQLQDAGE